MSTPEERAFLIAQDAKDSAMTDVLGNICGLDWLAYAIATAIREAEARGMERAAEIAAADSTWGDVMARQRAEGIAAAIRAQKERQS